MVVASSARNTEAEVLYGRPEALVEVVDQCTCRGDVQYSPRLRSPNEALYERRARRLCLPRGGRCTHEDALAIQDRTDDRALYGKQSAMLSEEARPGSFETNTQATIRKPAVVQHYRMG